MNGFKFINIFVVKYRFEFKLLIVINDEAYKEMSKEEMVIN